jgi:hypothetical protein
VEYTLHLTPKGKDVYQGRGYKNPFSDFPTFAVPKVSLWERFRSNFFLFSLFHRIKDFTTAVIKVVVGNPLLLLAIIWVNYRLLRWMFLALFKWLWPRTQTGAQRRAPRRSFWPSFFGGGGWFGGDDPPGPPPPYTRQPPSSSRKTYYVPPETQGWTPGFWTGLASGAAAGYGVGSRGSGSGTQTREEQRYNTRTSTENPAPQSSGWWSGRVSVNAPPASSPSRRDRDDNGSSGSTHTSTGFGGTRRR